MLIPALDYARLEWRVFPIEPKSKHPFAGSHGCKDGTTDPNIIGQWSAKHGDCNLGVATGNASGFFVWDVDPSKGGLESLSSCEDKHGKLPPTVLQLTGGGGFHYLFKMPEDGDVRNAQEILPGIDIRGTGGYIVVAPSIHPNGKAYEWEASSTPFETPIAEAPAWLLSLARAGASRSVPSSDGAQQAPVKRTTVERVPEGSRHQILIQHLGALRHVGAFEEELRSAAHALNMRFEPPFSKGDIEYQVTWAMEHWQPDTPMETYTTPSTEAWRWHPVGLKDILAANIPPIDWLIPGVIAKASVGLIGSPPKLGKSWLSLHILSCLASGKPFLGMPEFLGGCFRGLYVGEEDPERMVYSRTKRLWAGLNPSISVDGQMKAVVKSGFRLDKQECLKTLEETIVSEKLDIVIMDVFSRLHTKDGNKAEEIIPLLTALDGIRTRTGCAILIDTHFKKGLGDDAGAQGQRVSGSVGIQGWSENSLYLDWPKGQPGQAVIYFENKDGPHDPIVFSISTVEGYDEEDQSAPLILTGKPVFDGTKKGTVNRRAALLSLGVTWEKAGKPERGVPLSDIMPLLDHPMTETTLRGHLTRGGAISQKVTVGRAHVLFFRPPSESESSSSE